MIKLGSVVSLIHRKGVEGRVISRTDFIAGYSLYNVECLKDDPLESVRIVVHEDEMEVVSSENTVEDAVAAYELGTEVHLIGSDGAVGLVTGLHYSVSGCAECEIIQYLPGKGYARSILEEHLLEPVEDAEKIPVGAATGSVFRELTTR